MAKAKSDQGLGDLIGSSYDARQTQKGLGRNVDEEEKARQERLKLLDSLDWEPEYASAHVPTYQKTKSPIARSYLESMLLGQNPDMTFEGATNAKYKKAAQQRTMDNLYGTLPARAAEARAVQAETPWKVTTPTESIRDRGLSKGSKLGKKLGAKLKRMDWRA